MRRTITDEGTINGMRVQSRPGQSIIDDIVIGYQERVNYMLSQRAKVMVVYLVARFPKDRVYPHPNRSLSSALDKFRKKMQREGIISQIGWTREQWLSANPHYNIGIIADGTVKQDSYWIYHWFNEIWSREIDTPAMQHLVFWTTADPVNFPPALEIGTPKAHHIIIQRNSPYVEIQKENAIHWLSYSAKTAQKGLAPLGQNEYAFSRIPHGERIYNYLEL